ncbi:hypothetical protein [Aidingimonas lacisalsi]|uniref:hypothetical protein n=1 Tax=Aidingimonas lacisalsi TaxID=2604086 RepID=UPI0011D29CFB|nr:hypothetical protein [Aidingimonas lacisalsi]
MMGRMNRHEAPDTYPAPFRAMTTAVVLRADLGVPKIHFNIPAKPMAAPAVTLKSSGFSFAYSFRDSLRHALSAASISVNIPAKPMWTSVLKLKLRGFFIAREQDTPAQHPSHFTPEVAS